MKAIRYIQLLALSLIAVSCELKPNADNRNGVGESVEVQRYDRIESRYLTTGDFSALQQLSTAYPMETRTLIEDVLQLGEVNEPDINSTFLNFYQDTLLQAVITDVEAQYANMEDINKGLTNAFAKLKKMIPNMRIPMIYAQIGAFDQSIVVGNQSVGISLDKYLGKDYEPYKKYYTASQIESMERSFIVPDCLSFYLLSVYPLRNAESKAQVERDLHVAKVLWVVNKVMERRFFKSKYVDAVERYMNANKKNTVEMLLKKHDYSVMKNYITEA